MALLNNSFAIIITSNLVIQIVVLILLGYGYILKKNLKFRQHGIVMSISLILHFIMAMIVMIPSFVLAVIREYIIPYPSGTPSIVSLIHVVLGSIALTFGVWIVGSWRFSKNFQGCFNRKKYMKKTLVVWCASLVFGIVLYGIFIGPVLRG
ncbi:MAG: hypothetical protein ACM3UL_02085 [Ignavibacteria bacterium]